MDAFDEWDIAALVFFLSILAGISVYALVAYVNRHNPLTRADRRQLRSVSSGKRAMASDR